MRLLPFRLALIGACLALTLSPALARDNKDPTDVMRSTRKTDALRLSKERLMRRSQSDHQDLIGRGFSSASSAPSSGARTIRRAVKPVRKK
jgi:hypothetical protein